jgi:hypothetical protein
MAVPIIKGNQTPTFGIATTVTFLFLEQVDSDNEPEYIAQVADQNGIQISKAYGPVLYKANFSGTLNSTVNLTPGSSVFNYNGLNYIVEKITLTAKNNDFTKVSFSATSFAGIPNP